MNLGELRKQIDYCDRCLLDILVKILDTAAVLPEKDAVLDAMKQDFLANEVFNVNDFSAIMGVLWRESAAEERFPSVKNSPSVKQLKVFRELRDTLARRFAVISWIGQLKQQQGWIQPRDNQRWQQLLADRLRQARETGLSEDIVSRFFNTIHSVSVGKQEKISVHK